MTFMDNLSRHLSTGKQAVHLETPKKTFYAPGAAGPGIPIRAWVYIGIAFSWALLVCWVETLGQLHRKPDDVAAAIGYFIGSAFGAIAIPFAIAGLATMKKKPRNWLSFSKWYFWVSFVITCGFGLRRT